MEPISTPRQTGGVILRPEDVQSVRSTELAACLVTLGFRLLTGRRVVGDGQGVDGHVTWEFEPVSMDGKYVLGDVLRRWDDRVWLTDPGNSDPLAYIITAFHNRRRLIDKIKQDVGMCMVREGSRYALFRRDLDGAELERVMRFFGQ